MSSSAWQHSFLGDPPLIITCVSKMNVPGLKKPSVISCDGMFTKPGVQGNSCASTPVCCSCKLKTPSAPITCQCSHFLYILHESKCVCLCERGGSGCTACTVCQKPLIYHTCIDSVLQCGSITDSAFHDNTGGEWSGEGGVAQLNFVFQNWRRGDPLSSISNVLTSCSMFKTVLSCQHLTKCHFLPLSSVNMNRQAEEGKAFNCLTPRARMQTSHFMFSFGDFLLSHIVYRCNSLYGDKC